MIPLTVGSGDTAEHGQKVAEIGRDDPVLPDVHVADPEAVDPDPPRLPGAADRDRAADRARARLDAEIADVGIVDDAHVGAGVEHEIAGSAVDRRLDEVVPGGDLADRQAR
jgi:hypothetical protein